MPGTPIGIIPVYPLVAPTDMHFGWNQLNDSYPFVGSTSRWTGLPPTFAWANEIVGFQPSAGGKQFRFASSYITGLSPFFSTQYAIGSVSQSGKYFLFSSDWMNTLGSVSGGSTCIPNGPAWAAGKAYASSPYLSSYPANGGIITPIHVNAGKFSYQVTTAGTSGTVEPTWCQTTSCTNTDGTAVWTNLGAQGTTNACRGDVFAVQLN
jgi:hypothetical protein